MKNIIKVVCEVVGEGTFLSTSGSSLNYAATKLREFKLYKDGELLKLYPSDIKRCFEDIPHMYLSNAILVFEEEIKVWHEWEDKPQRMGRTVEYKIEARDSAKWHEKLNPSEWSLLENKPVYFRIKSHEEVFNEKTYLLPVSDWSSREYTTEKVGDKKGMKKRSLSLKKFSIAENAGHIK